MSGFDGLSSYLMSANKIRKIILYITRGLNNTYFSIENELNLILFPVCDASKILLIIQNLICLTSL